MGSRATCTELYVNTRRCPQSCVTFGAPCTSSTHAIEFPANVGYGFEIQSLTVNQDAKVVEMADGAGTMDVMPQNTGTSDQALSHLLGIV